jgi:hypothetical protein
MRWSPEGAHYLLQVRTELLNGTLPARYRILYPGFHQDPEYVDLVARRTPASPTRRRVRAAQGTSNGGG